MIVLIFMFCLGYGFARSSARLAEKEFFRVMLFLFASVMLFYGAIDPTTLLLLFNFYAFGALSGLRRGPWQMEE